MTWGRRHAVLGLLLCAYLLCYMDRMVMASAIPFIAREFHLSPLAVGEVLSAFFLAYALMQIPGGILADRLGATKVMTASIIGWSLFATLTGFAGSLATLLSIRFLFGLAEGPFPPTASKTIALWFPREEIGRANGLQLAAVNIGAAIAPLFVAHFMVHWGWRPVFYSLLLPGLALAIAVRAIKKGQPEIEPSAASGARARVGQGELRQVLKTPAVLWCAAALFLVNTVSWGLMNWLPSYLLQARGFSVSGMGIGASLPFLSGAAGYYLGGDVSDRHFRDKRHIPIAVGLLLGATMTWWAAVAPSGVWAVAALALAFFFLFLASSGLFTLPMLLVPQNAVGVSFGLVNTFGQVAAFLSPLLVGYVLAATQGKFAWAFYGFGGLLVASAWATLRMGRASASISRSGSCA